MSEDLTQAAPGPEAPTVVTPASVPAAGPASPTPANVPYEGQQSRRPAGGARRFSRRKVCQFCADKIDYIDYKDTKRIRKFMTDRGKILPRRITGNCAAHQRMLTNAIKRARVVALVPFKSE
jgi:small subunit ribosomal protein S18